MTIPIVVIGAGGFGREVVGLIRAINAAAINAAAPHGGGRYEFIGFIDDGHPDPAQLARLSAVHLGGVAALAALPAGTQYCIAIGSGAARRSVDAQAAEAGLAVATLVHPDATVGPDVELGEGAIVCAGARLTDNIRTGRHVNIHVNSTIGHDTVLEDYASIFPLAAVSGNVRVGAGSTVGANSCVNQGLCLGDGAFVASGAAVTKDVDSHTLVAGVPAVAKKSLAN